MALSGLLFFSRSLPPAPWFFSLLPLKQLSMTTEKEKEKQKKDEANLAVFGADGPDRYTLFPIRHQAIWAAYKKHESSFWTTEEIDMADDRKAWQRLTEPEQHFIKTVLAFFAAADGIVVENLALRFMRDVQLPEARAFYGFQMAMENIHSETYSMLIEAFVTDPTEKSRLLRAMEEVEVIKAKAEWALRWIQGGTFAERLVAWALIEGVFFSASFAAIYWVKKRGLGLNGLTFSNELISRDEGLHCDFACLAYSMLPHPLYHEHLRDIVTSAVELEKKFVNEALRVDLIGIRNTTMCQYVEFVADRLVQQLGGSKIYSATNPFEWMEMISLQGKTNFFEKRVSDYHKAQRGDFRTDAPF